MTKVRVLRGGNKVEVMDVTDNSFCPTGKGGGVDPTCSPGGKSVGGGGGKSNSSGKGGAGNLKNDDMVKKMVSSSQKGSEIADYAASKHGFTEAHWEQVLKHKGFDSRDPKVKSKLVDKIDQLQFQYTPEGKAANKLAKESAQKKRAETKAAQAAALAKFKKRMQSRKR